LVALPAHVHELQWFECSARTDFYKLDHEDFIVVCDDMNLPDGKTAVPGQGSSGGQKGLQDIIRRLGTDAFPETADWDRQSAATVGRRRIRAWANSTPSSDLVIDKAVKLAADALADWVRNGVQTV
jgi:peptidyl-tRNA hydrolase, PTH1 family